MASAAFVPSNLPSPLVSFGLSTLQLRRPLDYRFNYHKLEAHLSSHTFSPADEYYSDPQPLSSTADQNLNRKKKKPNLCPSFYEQTLDHSYRNHPLSAPLARGAKPRNTKLGLEAETQNLVGGKSRLDMIVAKLNGSLDQWDPVLNDGLPSVCENVEERLDSKETVFGLSVSVDESSDLLVSPRIHEEDPRGAYYGFIASTPPESGKFRGKDGNCGRTPKHEKPKISLGYIPSNSTPHTWVKFNDRMKPNSTRRSMAPPLASTLCVSTRDGVMELKKNCSVSEYETHISLQSLDSNAEHGKSRVSSIVDKLQSSLGQDNPYLGSGFFSIKSDDEHDLDSDHDIANSLVSVSFPWERKSENCNGEWLGKRSNAEVVEKSIPEPELQRLRNVSLRMKERMEVGAAGVTKSVVERIHEKWKETEVVKLKFEGLPSLNMERMHEDLERKTGGLVIWRSGSSLVLHRTKAYSHIANTGSSSKNIPSSNDSTLDIPRDRMNDSARASKNYEENKTSSFPSQGFTDTSDIDCFLDQLGPRFKDWYGPDPLPVDADLLPGVVAGYKPPFRLLPYRVRSRLTNREMTSLRRLGRTLPPHFALGRSRQHQGLANSMVRLWERSAIAKIGVKRGVPNTCNERMAEDIKKLTGGVILSRNKEYIVFYRGNDFLKPSIREVLVEKENLATIKQDEEEVARIRASALIVSNSKTAKGSLVAGTLTETMRANARWAKQPSSEDRERMKRDLDLASLASLVRFFEWKLAFAQAKVRKAEKALAKVQESLQPAELPTDLETVTDEERFLFRKIGLKMRASLLLGRRDVFDGTIQNMHLNWKHRELVKLLVRGRNFGQVKHIAISLEAESGGVLISLDQTTKGYAIIIYRGKNYQRPSILRPTNLLTKRQALARSIELQRREALNHHISNLRKRIKLLKSQLDQMEADRELGNKVSALQIDDCLLSEDDVKEDGEEAYLQIYSSNDENDGNYDASAVPF